MIYEQNSFDYQMNKAAFREMIDIVPMTRPERKALRIWVNTGNDLSDNPWNYRDSDGLPMDYLQAYRLRFGYHSGPWDHWKGPDTHICWDETCNRFIPSDDFC